MKLNQTTYRFQTHILAICIRPQRGNYIYMRLRKNLRKCGLVNKFNYCMQLYARSKLLWSHQNRYRIVYSKTGPSKGACCEKQMRKHQKLFNFNE